jgi:tRNA dimethylallyltransferase
VIGGPTATGKTALSLRLADDLRAEGVHAEIISADSRQVYRGLDIGTAKVAAADRGRIPHHGLDLVEPNEPFNVAAFATAAATALEAIHAKNGFAILVGGTGLYLRAVGRGVRLGDIPSDPAVRAEIEAMLEADGGLPTAVEELARRAPRLAATADPRNPRRVARALEIARLVGDIERPAPAGYPGRSAWLGLDVEPGTHADWIAGRARAQFDAGLVDEAARLRKRFDPGLPAFSAIGYREAWAVLDATLSVDEGIAADARRNVAFARRQRTWFRAEPDISWFTMGEGTEPLAAALRTARDLIASS